MGKKAIFTARFAQDTEHAEKKVVKNKKLDCGYKLDVIVENNIILELKACLQIEAIHKAQLLTYLKLSGLSLELLLNFNTPVLNQGIMRVVNDFE